MKENIKEILNRLFFKEINGIWIGKIGNNKVIIMQDKSNDQELLLKTASTTNSANEQLFKFLDEQKNNNKIKTFNVEKNLLSLKCSADYCDFDVFLKDLSDVLTRLEAKDVCFLCNEIKETDAYKYKDSPTFLCSECAEKLKTEVEKAKDEPNHYLRGTFCCIIGALVGSLLWILIGYFGFYASIAGYFIAYCAFYGYNFAKGKATKIGAIINICAIVFALLLAEYIGLFLLAKKELNLDFLSFIKLSPIIFHDPAVIKSLLPSLGFGFLFAGLGSYKVIRSIFAKANELSNTSIEKI